MKHEGVTCYEFKNIDVDGRPVSKPMFVNMQMDGKVQAAIYRKLEQHIAIHNPKDASRITNKIKHAFKDGKIKNDSDFYRLVKQEIPDEKLAKEVLQELGDEPPRGSLAGLQGKNICKNFDSVFSVLTVAGFLIARDAVLNEISFDTFTRAGIAAAGTLAVAKVIDYGSSKAIEQMSLKSAKKNLKESGKKITKKLLEAKSKEIALKNGKWLGGGAMVIFSGWSIVNSIYKYNTGQLRQDEMIVDCAITATTAIMSAGVFFFTCIKWGAVAGPKGAAFGAVIGFFGGLFSGGYTICVEYQRQKRLLAEAEHLAKWETEHKKNQLDKIIREMKMQAEQARTSAWHGLLGTSGSY